MLSKVSAVMGAIVAVALVIVALWGWGAARDVLGHAARPQAAAWAVRSASVAALAGAQALGLTFVVGAFYSRDRAGEMMRLTASLICTAALVGAIVLAIASN